MIRFAGDSGDGMQVTGEQFTTEAAWAGNDISTLPNFPAEIRAPAGTLFGVSSFQLQFGSQRVYTPGDHLDALVAMNPAALKVHLADLKKGGILIVNTAAFDQRNLEKAWGAKVLDRTGWKRPAIRKTPRASRRTRSTSRVSPSSTGCTRWTSAP